MKEKDNHPEWWSRMADRLRSHEEPYQEGAWERFASRLPESQAPLPAGGSAAKVRRLSPWVFRVAAAVILLAGVVFFWPVDRDVDAPQLVGNGSSGSLAPDLGAAPGGRSPVEPVAGVESTAAVEPAQRVAVASAGERIVEPVHSVEAAAAQPLAVASSMRLGETSLLTSAIEIPTMEISKENTQQIILDKTDYSTDEDRFARFLAGEEQQNRSAVLAGSDDLDQSRTLATEESRWGMGLVVSPNLTSEQMNIGGGLRVAYQLNDRLSIRSGVAVGQFGVNTGGTRVLPSGLFGSKPEGPSGPTGGMDAPLSPNSPGMKDDAHSVSPNYHTRFLDSQTSSLLGLDIPLDLTYAISDRFYTSVGISYFGVLNERRTNHYVDRINEPVFLGSNAQGTPDGYQMKTYYVDGPANNQPLDGKGYAGFLNFSFGHQSRLTKKLRLSIEPFLKLPVGRLAGEDMNMTNGGIRIVTGF